VLLFVFWSAIGLETRTDRIGAIEKKSPALAGGLKPGDRLVSVDGVRGDTNKLSRQISSHRCPGRPRDGCRAAEPAEIVVQRGDGRRSFTITPEYDGSEGIERTRVGFGYARSGKRETLPVGQAADTSISQFWFITKATVSLPARIFNTEQRKEISGVVGSYERTRQTIIVDSGEVVLILALVSLSLAIVNLFPFLPLDGGHIFWAAVEKVRGRPVPLAVMERSGVIGFMLVIGLFLIGLTNDVGRITSGEGFTPP